MQLVGYWLDAGAGPVRQGWVPLADLTVIFGANDVGKSRLLAEMESDLAALSPAAGRHVADGLVVVEFTTEELDGVAAMTLEDLRTRHPEGADWEAIPVTGIEGWRAYYAQTLADGPDGAAVLRLVGESTTVAVESVESGDGRMGESFLLHWCIPDGRDLSDAEFRAVRRFVEGFELGMPPWGAGPIPVLRLGVFSGPLLPAAVRLPTSGEDLAEQVAAAVSDHITVQRLVDRLRGGDRALADEIESRGCLQFLDGPPTEWLTQTGAHAAEVSSDVVGAFRIVEAAAQEACAPHVAPPYRLHITPARIWEWSSVPARIWLTRPGSDAVWEHERTPPTFELGEIADGLKLWVQLAVLEGVDALRLSTLRLLSAAQLMAGDVWSGDMINAEEWLQSFIEAPEAEIRAIREGAPRYSEWGFWSRELLGHQGGRIGARALRATKASVYLVDEPERHLNPRVVRDTAGWLQARLAASRSQAIIVTHAVGFLAAKDAQLLHVRRDADGMSTVAAFSPGQITELNAVAEDLGLDRGELLGTIRLLLFVEGESDRAVLEALYRQRLWQSGIVVVPISGVRNSAAVAHADPIIRFCNVPVAVVFDAVNSELIHALTGDRRAWREQHPRPSTEATALARLLDLAEENGRTVRPIPLDVPDIFDALSDEVLADLYPGFPGHDEIARQWGAERPRDRIFWQDLEKRFGIRKSRDSLRAVAEQMAERGIDAPHLEAVVSEAETVAREW